MANVYGSIKQAGASQRAATAARETEVRGIYDKIAGIFAPEGTFGKGYAAILEATKSSDIARASQSLVSSGLSNTTRGAVLGQAWESEVGHKARLSAYDKQMQSYAGALQGKAGMVERMEDVGPDYGALAQYAYKERASAQPARRSSGYTLPSTIGPSWLGFKR